MFSFLKRSQKTESDMYVIVGLGNFGEKYANTRHNAGFIAADAFAAEHGISLKKNRKINAMAGETRIGEKRVMLVKPLTFMNRSGETVQALLSYYKIPAERVLVIYDDIDLPPGTLRIRKSGSAGTHNGMRSVVQQIGTGEFPRMRVGVGAQPKGGDLIKHVMGQIPKESVEAARLAAEAAQDWVTYGTEHAMSHYNKKG